MGKKNRRAKASSAEPDGSMSRSLRRELLELVGTLLERCSLPFGVERSEWDDFLEVNAIVERLRAKQQGYVMGYCDRAANMDAFMSWLKENEVDTTAVSIAEFEIGGYGLKANHDIEMSELILSIPRKIMMTTQTATASVLGQVMEDDRILQAMPNVLLSLHLLCERLDEKSFWAPYIKILPSSYTTFLYYTIDELQLLKGSQVLSNVLNQFRNITRQYAYFFKLFQGYTDADYRLPIKNFCYDDYRWAVSTVMTRQNKIPVSSTSQQMDMALIPFWDMCNHCNGKITTDYNLEKDCSECYSLNDFKENEQVFIFYGPRSNSELLLHSGFVYPLNESDKLALQLGISKADPLYSMKSELLARMSMLPSRLFFLHKGENPVNSELLIYLRIFSMDQDQLQAHLTGDDAAALTSKLKFFDEALDLGTELKGWSFLEARMELLLQGCDAAPFNKHVAERQDGRLGVVNDASLSERARTCVQLRLAEKCILEATRAFAARQKRGIAARMEDDRAKRDAPAKVEGSTPPTATDDGEGGIVVGETNGNAGGFAEGEDEEEDSADDLDGVQLSREP